MPDTPALTPKMLVAKELLHKALEAYFDDAYFAAIHMAGAAEEILGTYVNRLSGLDNAFTSLQNLAVGLSGTSTQHEEVQARKEIYALMVRARNRTKHIHAVGDDEIHFDAKSEAKDILERAVTDYYHLMNYVALEDSAMLRRFDKIR